MAEVGLLEINKELSMNTLRTNWYVSEQKILIYGRIKIHKHNRAADVCACNKFSAKTSETKFLNRSARKVL